MTKHVCAGKQPVTKMGGLMYLLNSTLLYFKKCTAQENQKQFCSTEICSSINAHICLEYLVICTSVCIFFNFNPRPNSEHDVGLVISGLGILRVTNCKLRVASSSCECELRVRVANSRCELRIAS